MKKHTIEDVKDYLLQNNGNCSYVSGEYQNNLSPLVFKCHLCGKTFVRDFAHLQRGRTCCEQCARKKRDKKLSFSISTVKQYLEEHDNPCTLISEEYVNSRTPLKFQCKCGEYFFRDFDHLKRGAYHCEKCYRESLRTYKFDEESDKQGRQSDLLTNKMRSIINPWREEQLKKNNYICEINGETENLEVHHLENNFSDLLYQATKELNLPFYKYSYNYTKDEYDQIANKLLQLHKDINGVVLTRDLHILFHQQYGKTNNTKEQYLRFKEKYKK